MAAAGRVADPPNDGGCKGGRRRFWFIDALPKGIIDSPIEFIAAEHYRQREAAAILSAIASGGFHPKGVEALITFLETDFSLHIGDEEIVLFPALKVYCQPEDDVEHLIARLVEEHKEDESSCERATALLRKRLNGEALSNKEARVLQAFSEHIRQHLALENGVLLPIARVRLDSTALTSISTSLKQRRGR